MRIAGRSKMKRVNHRLGPPASLSSYFPFQSHVGPSSPSIHFANTLASTHASLVWAYFGAKEIDFQKTPYSPHGSSPLPRQVDRVVHLDFGLHTYPLTDHFVCKLCGTAPIAATQRLR